MENFKIGNKTHKAAGILPVVEINNTLHFILGKERSGKYSDFGGYKDSNETCEQTAIREFDEESMGVLFNKKKLEQIITKLPRYYNKKENYAFYLLKMEYRPDIIKTYNTLLRKISLCNNKKIIYKCKNGLLEKLEFKLFSAEQIFKNKKLMRDRFIETFMMLFNKLSKI